VENRLGKTIFMVGLPCSGKSTLSRLLSERTGYKYFCEPEAIDWPRCVLNRSLSGNFGAAMWFRSIRSNYYYEAKQLAANGEIVFVDSYFEKVFSHCLGRPYMDWLVSKDDPYFPSLLKIAQLDYSLLPLPDILIFFDLEFEEWMKLVSKRDRGLESEWFNRDFFQMQSYLKEAVEDLRYKHGCNVIMYKPTIDDLQASLNSLAEHLNLKIN
jgi:deoxyadenosine/deoxycytidine kinase